MNRGGKVNSQAICSLETPSGIYIWAKMPMMAPRLPESDKDMTASVSVNGL